MNTWFSLLVVLILVLVAMMGVQVAGLQVVFGVVVPYLALITFIGGVIYKVLRWAKTPVPFRITTTTGQAKSLPFIKHSNLESPHNKLGVIGRMFLEVVFFRSLFRNTKSELTGGRLVYGSEKYLWAASIAFHYCFLAILLRHVKYFVDPTPAFVGWIEFIDGFFQIGLPILYLTDAIFLAAVGYLFLRRVVNPKIRYISLAADYFPLFLILAIGTTGVLMRYFTKVEIVDVKTFAMSLATFSPNVEALANVNPLFYIHFFLICILIAYIPFSKLMHMGGIFFSPTRNMANDNRARRHVNPWNYDVKLHTYEEYEDEFRTVMKAAGLPLEKEE